MIKLDRPVIVEGKYDKIALENIVDALIIPTDGFGIFKNKERCAMIRRIAGEKGIIIMTDSDSAGAQIRAYIKKIAGDCEITNVYVPCLKGKERRKASPSKEGLLGVEGMSPDVILKALERSSVRAIKDNRSERKITKTDMFCAGLSGTENSSFKKKTLLKRLNLPESLSPNAMLDVLNELYSYEEFCEVTENL